MKKGTKKILIGTGIAVAAIVGLLYTPMGRDFRKELLKKNNKGDFSMPDGMLDPPVPKK